MCKQLEAIDLKEMENPPTEKDGDGEEDEEEDSEEEDEEDEGEEDGEQPAASSETEQEITSSPMKAARRRIR